MQGARVLKIALAEVSNEDDFLLLDIQGSCDYKEF